MHIETFKTTKDIKETKIVLFSDIHYYQGYKQKILDRLLTQTKIAQPDYICIAGDVLDYSSVSDFKVLFKWLEQLSNIAPLLVVLGNHDEKNGNMGHWKSLKNKEYVEGLKQLKNVYLLDNTTKTFNDISFYGFNLSYQYYEEQHEDYNIFKEEVKNLDPSFNKDNYNIILFHSPINIYKYIKENNKHPFNKCDLILSGHMHNGCLPYCISHPINKLLKTSRSLISPLRKIFPDFSHGRLYNKVKDGYIYEGVCKFSKSTRFFHKLDFIYQKNIQIITIKKDI